MLRAACLAALCACGAVALPLKPSNASAAARAHTQHAIKRYRQGERVRLLHGSGQIPEVTMEFWKEVTTGPEKGPTLIIAAAGGEGAPGSAASYIANFERFGIEMVFLPIYGSNCPDLVDDPVILDLVRDAHAIYFSGGMPGMLQGCLYGNDGRQ